MKTFRITFEVHVQDVTLASEHGPKKLLAHVGVHMGNDASEQDALVCFQDKLSNLLETPPYEGD